MRFVLVMLMVMSQFGSWAQKNAVLVPYRVGNKMGISNLNGKLVVKADYDYVEPMGENLFKFSNYEVTVDTLRYGGNQYKLKRTTKTTSGVIAGTKVILPESDVANYVLTTAGFIVGAKSRYSKEGALFFNKKGEKIVDKQVLSFRFVDFDDTGIVNKGKHAALIIAFADNTYNILDFQNSTQSSKWMFEKNVTDLRLEGDYAGPDFFVFSFTDENYQSKNFSLFYDATADELKMSEFTILRGRVNEGDYHSGDGTYVVEASPDDFVPDAIPPMDASDYPRSVKPAEVKKVEPTVFMYTKKDGLIASGKKINLGENAEAFLADRYAQFQRFPVIYKSNRKYGIVYSDTVVGAAEYDSLVYVKGNVPRQGEVHFYLAGKKQEDGKLKFGLINKEGEEVFPMIYDELIPNLKEITQVKNETTDVDSLVIRIKRSSAWDLGWNTDLIGNYFSALKDGKWGVITLEGETLLPFEYEEIFSNSFHFATSIENNSSFNIYKKKGKYGIFRIHNKAIESNSGAVFQFMPVFYYKNYNGVSGLQLFNLATQDNFYHCLSTEDGKHYLKR